MAIAKRDAAEAGRSRMQRAALGEGQERLRYRLPRNLTEVEEIEGVEWLAIVHLDGNGLGGVFAKFSEVSGASNADDYLQELRRFSEAVDRATKQAFRHAVRVVGEVWSQNFLSDKVRPVLPLVPLVLGGDDLTLALEGRLAIRFAREFLLAFEQASADDQVISNVARRRQDFPAPYLAACAGIAIVKPHFPFYDAYGLCEQLLRRAKTVKHHAGQAACSAIDFHVLRDSNNADLQRITAPLESVFERGEITVKRLLYHRPCIVTRPERYAQAQRGEAEREWIESHRIERLDACIEALSTPTDDGRRTVLSSSFLHRLRDALFDGGAEQRIIEAEQGRKQLHWLRPFCADDQISTLFHTVAAAADPAGGEIRYTQLLDAIENEPFWSMNTNPTTANLEGEL